MKHYSVQADADTGEWLMDTMKQLPDTTQDEHNARQDTDTIHYDQMHDEDTGNNVAITLLFSKG